MVTRSKSLPKRERFEGTIISSEDLGEEERIDYVCPECHRNLVKLSDRQGNNQDWFCKSCSISFSDTQQIQIKSKLTNPYEEDIEPAISIVNVDFGEDVEIRHTPPVRGGLAELQKRGLKITYYHTTEKK